MACFRPLKAVKTDTGVVIGGACMRADWRPIQIPCGKCDGCRLEYSRQWAVRGVHELQLHEQSSFITLTYSDEHMPENRSLRYEDFRLFHKRLRRKLGPFRFLMCGEYGALHIRPHYHACLFGIGFDDKKYWRKTASGCDSFRSEILEGLWPFGSSEIGDVNFESIAYVARYTLKKVGSDVERLGIVDFSTGELSVRVPEFSRMSNRPAIGKNWWLRFGDDVKRRGDVVIRGRSMRPPRYYDKLLEKEDPLLLQKFRSERLSKVRFEDGTPDRLKVQEIVCKAGLAFKKRSL